MYSHYANCHCPTHASVVTWRWCSTRSVSAQCCRRLICRAMISVDLNLHHYKCIEAISGNSGARLLAKALQINTTLHTAHIDRNRIGADGWIDIAHALREYVIRTIVHSSDYSQQLDTTAHALSNSRPIRAGTFKRRLWSRTTKSGARVGAGEFVVYNTKVMCLYADRASARSQSLGNCRTARQSCRQRLSALDTHTRRYIDYEHGTSTNLRSFACRPG